MKSRIRIALWLLPAAGIIGLVGVLLRGPNALPIPDSIQWAAVATQPIFMMAHFLLIIGYVLPFIGFWALYEIFKDQKGEKSAFWGFMLSVWGTALALPALGIAAFAGPLAAEAFLADNPSTASMITDAVMGSGFIVGMAAAVGYTIGPALYGVAIWRSSILPKWAGLLFALHGICLSLGFGLYPVLVIGWVLFIVSSGWIAMSYLED